MVKCSRDSGRERWESVKVTSGLGSGGRNSPREVGEAENKVRSVPPGSRSGR